MRKPAWVALVLAQSLRLRVYPHALFHPLPPEKGGYSDYPGTTSQPALTIGYLQSGAQPSS
jgi:hypothetical protein